MKSHRTHRDLTKTFFPNLNDNLIEEINTAIDNPTDGDIMMQQMMEQAFGKEFAAIPGVWKGGHRKYNHDLFSSAMIGLQKGGYDGMLVAMNHMMQDGISDQMVSMIGMEGRDLFESAYLYLFGRK